MGRMADPREAECLTGDRNLLYVPAVVQYEVSDPASYLFRVSDTEELLRAVTASALSRAIATRPVDDVLTVDRLAIQEEARRSAQDVLRRCGVGVRIVAVALEGLSAPREVADAFRDVTRAREDRGRAINEADGYAKRLIPQTRGDVGRIRLEAEAYREEAREKARGEVDRFERLAATVREHRTLSFRRLFLEKIERILPRLKKIVVDESSGPVDIGILEGGE
jgi:membrane protease subunit HflK